MVTSPSTDLAATLAEVARELDTPHGLDETLQVIVDAAVKSMPEIDHVAITIAHRNGWMETRAASDDFVRGLDALQYEVGEGPCVYAMDAHRVVRVEHAESETRWPRFIPAAVERGLQAQLGLQLYVDQQTLGALNMYSTSAPTISDDVVHFAEIFATHASLALGHTRREEHLSTAIGTRQLIGQATGILVERYQVSEERAFDYLIRVSSHTNTKLRDIASGIVADAEGRYLASGANGLPAQ